MGAKQLFEAFTAAGKRTHFIGDIKAGVIIALDMEGRLFTVLNNKIVNRVNTDAIAGYSSRTFYLNPGGDGLWPAPEGTTLGYQYPTGYWRPSPSLRSARYMVVKNEPDSAIIEAEVDLINNQGHGIPTIFKRQIKITTSIDAITVNVFESITYIGSKELSKKDCLLAPWSLCQFDSGSYCKVVFPCKDRSSVWDLYDEPSDTQRVWNNGLCTTHTLGNMRYQIAIGEKVPWIEFQDGQKGLIVRRTAGSIQPDHFYIDISDASPQSLPSNKGVRYSIYSDPVKFMEIEAVGGSPNHISPGTEMCIEINTSYRLTKAISG